MHRNALLEKLAAHTPDPGRESEMAEELRRFVLRHPDCFERSLQIGHITASAWIVDPERTQALLTHHRKLDKWLQLGGHADGDPDVLQVALREAREESNLKDIRAVSTAIFDVDIHAIPARGAEPEHFHYDVRFLLEADPRAPLIVTRESRALAWVGIDRVGQFNTEESIARMLAKTHR